MVPPYQLVEVPVIPPYHLTKILKLCKRSFYELKVIVLMNEKMLPVSLKPNLNVIKIGQKLVVSCGPPLPTGGGACGPPLPQNASTVYMLQLNSSKWECNQICPTILRTLLSIP